MPRTFANVRISTGGQTTENQIKEIEAAGFQVDRRRVVSETVSGSSAREQQPGFGRLLDRLGRKAIDVAATVAELEAMGVRVHCLALGGADLTSPAGKLTMGVINAVAQFERGLLIERTQVGLERDPAEGTTLGRPATFDDAQGDTIRAAPAAGASVSALAKQYGTSRQTVMRAKGASRFTTSPSLHHPETQGAYTANAGCGSAHGC